MVAGYICYRAVNSFGNTIEFLLRKHRDAAVAKAFFWKAFKYNDYPKNVSIDLKISKLRCGKSILSGRVLVNVLLFCFTNADFYIDRKICCICRILL